MSEYAPTSYASTARHESSDTVDASGLDFGLDDPTGRPESSEWSHQYELIGGSLYALVTACADANAFFATAGANDEGSRMRLMKDRVDKVLKCGSLQDISSLHLLGVRFTQEELDYLASPLLDVLFTVRQLHLSFLDTTADAVLSLVPVSTAAEIQAALNLAAAHPNGVQAVRYLLDRGARIGKAIMIADAASGEPATPLASACRNSRVDTAAYLLRRGAVPEHLSILAACAQPDDRIIELLCEHKADLRAITDMFGAQYDLSPMCRAVSHNYYQVVEVLLKYGVDINAFNGAALRAACTAGLVETARALLTHPALDISLFTDNDVTVVIQNGHLNTLMMLEQLAPHRALYGTSNSLHSSSVLTAAVSSGSVEMFEFCLERVPRTQQSLQQALLDVCRAPDLQLVPWRRVRLQMVHQLLQQFHSTPVHFDQRALRTAAFDRHHVGLIELLMRHGALKFSPDVFLAACEFPVSVLHSVLDHAPADFGPLWFDQGLITALSEARGVRPDIPVVMLLLSRGANIHANDHQSLSKLLSRRHSTNTSVLFPLFVRMGWLNVTLLDEQAVVTLMVDKIDESSDDVTGFQTLFDLGVTRPRPSSLHDCALKAARRGSTAWLQLLIDLGFDLKQNRSVFDIAVSHNQLAAVHLLLTHGAEVRSDAHMVLTPGTDRRVIQLLLEYGADPNCADGKPMQTARLFCQKGIIELLLRFGAEVRDGDNDTLSKVAGTRVNPESATRAHTQSKPSCTQAVRPGVGIFAELPLESSFAFQVGAIPSESNADSGLRDGFPNAASSSSSPEAILNLLCTQALTFDHSLSQELLKGAESVLPDRVAEPASAVKTAAHPTTSAVLPFVVGTSSAAEKHGRVRRSRR